MAGHTHWSRRETTPLPSPAARGSAEDVGLVVDRCRQQRGELDLVWPRPAAAAAYADTAAVAHATTTMTTAVTTATPTTTYHHHHHHISPLHLKMLQLLLLYCLLAFATLVGGGAMGCACRS